MARLTHRHFHWQTGLREIFKRRDTDGDGELDFAEFVSLVEECGLLKHSSKIAAVGQAAKAKRAMEERAKQARLICR